MHIVPLPHPKTCTALSRELGEEGNTAMEESDTLSPTPATSFFLEGRDLHADVGNMISPSYTTGKYVG